jgi:CRP-like cAMP-binding protein
MTVSTHLRSIALFAHLRETELEAIAAMARSRDFPKNSLILSPRDAVDTFYVVIRGNVKSTLIAEDGREVILSLLGPGDFFGELALFDDDVSMATAIAMEPTTLLCLRREDLYRGMLEMPGVAIGLLRSLSRRLAEADHKIGGLILLGVSGRIAHLLLQLADQHDGRRISNPPTHQTMAQLVGSSRETVSRVLSDFASSGIITLSRAAIVIENAPALELATGHLRRMRTPRSAYDGSTNRRSLA